MSKDFEEIAQSIIREHGPVRAMEIAVKETACANEQGDNYGLSIWRDVKRILREQTGDNEIFYV